MHNEKRWQALDSTLSLWHQAKLDAAKLPSEAWKNWAVTAVVGWVLTLLLMLLMSWAMQQSIAIGILSQAMEERWLTWLIERSPVVFSDAVWMSAPGDPIIIIPILIAAAVIAARMGYPLHAITILISYFAVALIVFVSWQMWDRARPEVVLGGKAAPNINSFPSGHMAQIAAVYSLFFYYWLRRTNILSERIFGVIVLTIWIGVVGIARLEQSAHWITDVIAGVIIGLVWFGVLVEAIRRAERVEPDNVRNVYQSTSQPSMVESVDHSSD